ncbi:MAG: FAD-dependent thymidylate synthase [Oscillospiraceae bacterium]
MNVYLLAHTVMPEKLVANAARLCYSNSGIEDLLCEISDEKAKDFVEMLSGMGHESPIEHASFTFGIEGVSRSLLAQITRHRIASFSVQSQRYVRLDDFKYVTPHAIADDQQAAEIYQNSMKRDAEDYCRLTEILKQKYVAENLAAGMSEKKAAGAAEKKAIEDARYVLPNSCETKMVVTMNARSLLNFFRHRCCNRAQWEIRELAEAMFKLVYDVAPALFESSGPPCACGSCPEGKMTCGQAAEMREKYNKLKEG